MSKVAISGAATGTATFTIESPATSTNRTLTIPDATTTIVGTDATQTLTNKSMVATQLTGDVAAARITTALNATGSAPIFAARAWVNFNGTGTVAIRASGNVSSITDNSTGNYTINFTTALVDVNYSGVFGCNDNGNTSTFCYRTSGTKTTSAFQVSTASGLATLADNDMCMCAIFR